MSTNGSCIEPNYVVPGSNPCRDDNPDNLAPTAPTNISSAVLGITTWGLSFTQGQFARTNSCYVTLPDGSNPITGFCSGNIASFFGLTANTAYIATITSINQFGSTASSPPFAFTTGVDPGFATNIAVSYCDIAGTLQISYTPAPFATSHTAVMNAVAPSTFSINGVPTATPNHFTFTGYPVTIGVNYPVTIVITSSNIYKTNQSVPLNTTTFSPRGGKYTSQNVPMYGTIGPYTSPTIAIPIPADFALNVNSAAFASPYTTTPAKLTVNGTFYTTGGSGAVTWRLTTNAGNGVSNTTTVGNGQNFNNQILAWTANDGTLTLITGMTPGGNLNVQFSWASLSQWSITPLSYFNISYIYNQGLGTLTP